MARQIPILVVFVLLNISIKCINGQSQPCYFIFGDSFSTNGNDDRNEIFKANYTPYGLDFPGGPTGRFSNGKTMIDFIAQKIGMKDFNIQPFKKAGNGSELLKGVNYATASARLLLNATKKNQSAPSLSQQVRHHLRITRRMDNLFGGNKNKTRDVLNKCLYSIGMGSNNYLIDFYTNPFNGSQPIRKTPSDAYAHTLVDQYLYNNLRSLYVSGARNLVLFGLPPLGCTPGALDKYNTKETCVTAIDQDVQTFNTKLRALVDRLNKDFRKARFTYINLYDITKLTALPNFKEKIYTCCDTENEPNGLCVPKSTRCNNVENYYYFDGWRPTEGANRVLANLAYNATVPTQAYPYNINQMASEYAVADKEEKI